MIDGSEVHFIYFVHEPIICHNQQIVICIDVFLDKQ